MTLPNNFSEWEHLQSLILRYHNQAVRNYFKNQPDDDISTPKASLKHACLMKPNDTVAITQFRQWLFEVTIGHLQAVNPVVYGIPVEEHQRVAKFKPQVRLVFSQPRSEVDDETKYKPHISEITFRLMDETSETISRANAESLARTIKNQLATPPLIWEKGWYKYTYFDLERGYDFRLMVRSETVGKQMVRAILGVQNHAFNEDNGNFQTHSRTYPINPGTHRVYGRNRRKYVRRPRVNVKFRSAQLHIHGLLNPIQLVAVGTRIRSAIERV